MSGRGYYKARVPGTLKDAQAALIAACGGPVAAAEKCRLGKSVLQIATDADHPTRNLPVDVVECLEAACGDPIVTRYLAISQNCLVEPVHCDSIDPLAVVVGRVTAETGDVLSAAARDVQAGRLTRANAIGVLKETDELVAALIALRTEARAVVEAQP